MKTRLFICLVLLAAGAANAQVCPGGGTGFSSAVLFNPAWIYGCNTGTSCNGGVAFDNRTSCEPTTAIDACAPSPSCGNASNIASDVWFKFYPGAANVLISCFQNTSLVIGIQAFSGSACGALTEIGCVSAAGPSSGAQLALNGLNAGTLYYFRIFGNANPVSQRTGLYCFCGSSGLGNFMLLPTIMTGFSAQAYRGKINLAWTIGAGYANQSFDIERSSDQRSFTRIANLTETVTGIAATYHYTDDLPLAGDNYYRIKHQYADGHADYSGIIKVTSGSSNPFSILTNPAMQTVQVVTSQPAAFALSDIAGNTLQVVNLRAGTNTIATSQLANGIYILRCVKTGSAQKFFVSR